MARKRHAVNPAKVRADLSVLDTNPPPEIFQRRLELRRKLSVLLLCLLSVVLLSVSFAPFDCWYLAYVALVPWGLALAGGEKGKWTLMCATLAGALFWAANLYWLWWITLIGYAAMSVYLTIYWLVAAVVFRAAARRNWPMCLVLPILWVALEYVRAYVISGFPWFFLAHTQYRQTMLIQIVDLTGQYGVSFFVAMVNGALIDLLISPLFRRRPDGPRMRRQILLAPCAALAVLAGMLGYGAWRLSENTTQPGPVVGIVQGDFPIFLHDAPASETSGDDGAGKGRQRVFETHMELSSRFIGKDCQLVIWPETMLPAGMNAEFMAASAAWTGPNIELLRSQAERLGELSGDRELRCPILAGGIGYQRNPAPTGDKDQWLSLNGAIFFDGDSRSSAEYYKMQEYYKMHLVPFGEYVPFKHTWPWLHRTLRRFVPPVMNQLTPGEYVTRFELPRKDASKPPWRLATPICFEGTFARVCRRMVVQKGRKVVDILVNMSNDGWFVTNWGSGPYQRSTEHAQHLAQYVFRAIESRVPVVRSVNTGISGLIDSNGRIVSILQYGGRTMVSGTLLLDGARRNDREFQVGHGGKVLVDSRVSGYSLMGDVFAIAVVLAAIAMVGRLLWKRRALAEGKTQ